MSEGRVLSEQQQRVAAKGLARLNSYRELVVGNGGWAEFIGFELVTVLLSGIAGALGMVARSLCHPFFFRSIGSGVVIGKGVTIRQPGNITLGKGVVLDDYAVLDIRSGDTGGVIEIGSNVLIGRGTIVVSKGGTIRLADSVNISSSCRIATQGSIQIDEGVLIAAYAYIGPGNHRIDDPTKALLGEGMEIKGGVRIGANSWIGAHATVLDGVTIGRNVVVGAHALVRRDVPDNAVVGGVPAKILRMREANR